MKFYAIKVGRKTGIFTTWKEAKEYVLGFPDAKYKAFRTIEEAQEYLMGNKPTFIKEISPLDKGIIYTDGSCKNNVGGYGYLYLRYDGKCEPYCGQISGYCTNQIAELQAIYQALLNCPFKVIDLYSDSEYSINCFTEWYPNWIRNGWKNSKGKPVANRELIEKIIELLKVKQVTFYHVYSHTGNFYNEMVDKLANKGRAYYE